MFWMLTLDAHTFSFSSSLPSTVFFNVAYGQTKNPTNISYARNRSAGASELLFYYHRVSRSKGKPTITINKPEHVNWSLLSFLFLPSFSCVVSVWPGSLRAILFDLFFLFRMSWLIGHRTHISNLGVVPVFGLFNYNYFSLTLLLRLVIIVLKK